MWKAFFFLVQKKISKYCLYTCLPLYRYSEHLTINNKQQAVWFIEYFALGENMYLNL